MRIGSTLYYILKDHLGSASIVTDSTGTIVSGSEQRYHPYGESRLTGTMLTDKLFTGQRDVGLGIYHYGARFRVAPPTLAPGVICLANHAGERSGVGYSPKLGRFLSADTIVPGAANPQAYNRYSYVLGNPLKFIDPTGHYCVGDDEDCADEAGDGPAPSGSGGGSGGGANDPIDMETSEEGVDFIIYWENAGGPPDAYPYPDLGGNCTIGYGHLLSYGECTGAIKKYYRDNPLSPQGAEDFLAGDLKTSEKVIKKTITVDLTQAQFDALVSYIYNAGGAYQKKNIAGLINSGNFQAAAEAIANGPHTTTDVNTGEDIYSDTLDERRQDEAYLFLNGIYLVP